MPSRNAWNSEISRDGARHDCQALLSRRGSRLQVVCLGPVAERGNAWESAHHTIDSVINRVQTRSLEEAPERTELGGEEAIRYVIGERNGRRLHEWKLAREGWSFAVGILVQPDDRAALSLGQQALATWQWQSEVVVADAAPSNQPVAELNITRTVPAPPGDVWNVLRTLEGQAALQGPLVKAFKVPRRPDDLGDRYAFVKQRKGYRRTSFLEVIEEHPPVRLVMSDPYGRYEHLRMIFELTPLPLRGETNVTLTLQYAASIDRQDALRQRGVAEQFVEQVLIRLKAINERSGA
ncbi:MAG TPA: SRPBCC domain-containing protein [Mycobacteriales bacterium]|nr:SRPBCC domain-containing protein [Mycobacteriales bacterium]